MSRFDRDTEPEDYVRDALVTIVAYRAYEYRHDSFKDERMENAVLLLLKLMEIDGVNLEEYFFHDADSRKLAVTNALSRMNMQSATFSKVRDDGRHHFEPYFGQWAPRIIEKDLPEELRSAAQAVVEEVMQTLTWGASAEEAIEKHKKLREATSTATP